MKFKLILILSCALILTIVLPGAVHEAKPDISLFWHGPEYKNVIRGLEENGFSMSEIDSMFRVADSALVEFKKQEKEKEERTVPEEERMELFSEESINLGKEFLREYAELLEKVAKKYGIPKEIQAGILRIETCFGDSLGQYYVFGVFDAKIWPPTTSKKARRAKKSAEKEMIALFIICRDNRLNIAEIMGSKSGAFGIVQFMPQSYLRLAVDGNKDEITNLFEWEDALASMANYLKKAGWRNNRSTKRNRKALHAYNHSWRYANAVVKYARKIGFKK